MYIKFLNSNNPVKCVVVPNGNIVTLKFKDKVVVNTSGFRCYLDEKCEYDISGNGYIDFTTIYREDEETAKYNGYQLSNDGSIWVKPKEKVNFNTNGGGSLDGAINQEVYTYEELVIPTPVASENYEFTNWNPEIPLSGEVDGNKSFTAIFTSTLPPEPTIEERLSAVEINNVTLTETVDSILTDVIPSIIL